MLVTNHIRQSLLVFAGGLCVLLAGCGGPAAPTSVVPAEGMALAAPPPAASEPAPETPPVAADEAAAVPSTDPAAGQEPASPPAEPAAADPLAAGDAPGTAAESPAPATSVAESPAAAAAPESPASPPAANPVPQTAPPATPAVRSEDSKAGPAAKGPKSRTKAAASRPPPFERRIAVPEFPKHLEWLNGRPLTKADLKGKFVLLDFWTYCCINCMHILPELKKLEKEFPNNLVVIGVHSAKFDTEKGTENIREAILRYEIEHPVINDNNHELWDTYEVNSWPTICLIDPEGMFVGRNSGEFKAPLVSAVIQNALPYYREQGLLDEKPLDLQLEAHKVRPTPLRFPGKILADEKGGRLFITDSNHNRIVVTTLDGRLLEIIGSGGVGRGDGDYQNATFNHPQGCALVGNTLYVADTENHLLRKVELDTKSVTTIAGTGEQGDFTNAFPGWDGSPLRGQRKRWLGAPQATPLNSPWALWVHKKDLFIAMAGYHQIWKMPLDEKEIGPYAGNGREDIVDGPRMPTDPFRGGSSFAQPSGLSSDGKVLFVADSEGSSIRAVPLESLTRPVDTVIGTSHLATSRLFTFGDVDGGKGTARLQHCLEVVFHEGKLYVADTYNHKIKVVDPKTGDTKTFAGTGKPGRSDDPAEFREPAGLAAAKGKLFVADTNNHLIRTIDIATGKVATLAIPGLTPPGASSTDAAGSGAQAPPAGPAAERPDFATAQQVNVPPVRARPTGSAIQLHVKLEPPAGWKINPLAPMSYWLDAATPSGPADRAAFGRVRLPKPTAEFDVPVKVSGTGEETIRVALSYFYCQESDNGVCKIGAVVFNVPVTVADDGTPGPIELSHTILE